MELVQLIVQKKWNGRKRSETVGNMIRPKLVQPAFLLKKTFPRNAVFFWRSKGVQGETVGNSRRSHLRSTCFYIIFKHASWTYASKTTIFLPSEGAISDCFQPFPLGHLWTFKKRTALRGNVFFKEMRVGQVLAWSCFRLFPTVSFFLND